MHQILAVAHPEQSPDVHPGRLGHQVHQGNYASDASDGERQEASTRDGPPACPVRSDVAVQRWDVRAAEHQELVPEPYKSDEVQSAA